MKSLFRCMRVLAYAASTGLMLGFSVLASAQLDISPNDSQLSPNTSSGGGSSSATDILRRLSDRRSSSGKGTGQSQQQGDKEEKGLSLLEERQKAREERNKDKDKDDKGDEKTGGDDSKPTMPEGSQEAGKTITGADREPAKRAEGGGQQTVKGKGGGGTVRTVESKGGTVSVKGATSTYDPILDKQLEYGDVPDDGEAITDSGPKPVSEFLQSIVDATGWSILVTEEAQQKNLQFWLNEVKPKNALEILKFNDIFYRFDKETKYLYVMTKDEYLKDEFGKLKQETFALKFVDTAYMESMLGSLMSAEGRIVSEPRTMRIYVWDTEENLEKMRETVKELDVPLEKIEFAIQFADVQDIEAVLSTLKTETGTIIIDARTGQLLVWDVPDALEKMRMAVKELDVPLESRVFKLKHIDAEAITESLEGLLTERGMIQSDPRTNTLIVRDLPTRQEQIASVVETLDQQLRTKTWTIQFAEAEDIADQVEFLVPEEMGIITVNEVTHQVTITATPERIDEIDKLIQTWDVKLPQVQIEAYLVTASRDLSRSFGINWTFFDSTGNTPLSLVNGVKVPVWGSVTPTNSDSSSSSSTAKGPTGSTSGQQAQLGQLPYSVPLRNWFTGDVIKDIQGNPVIKEISGNRVSAVIEYLENEGDVKVLSHPRVTVQDGQEAAFQKTSLVPYVSSSYYGNNYSGGYNYNYNDNNSNNNNYYRSYNQPSNQIEFIEVGTILRVVPRISEDGSIMLIISAEESNYTMREVVGANEKSTVPEKTQNVTETQVTVHNAETIVIGGLRVGNLSDSVGKVPLLGDIPLLGKAFQNTTKTHKNEELLIFITPTIVGEFSFPEAERLAKTEEAFGKSMQDDKKDFFARMGDELGADKNTIIVSIGQSGHMHSGGSPITLDQLREKCGKLKRPAAVKIVIRKHPRAPEHISAEIKEMALELGMKFEVDDAFSPFVPNYDAKKKAEAEKSGMTIELPAVESAPAEKTEDTPAAAAAPAPAAEPPADTVVPESAPAKS